MHLVLAVLFQLLFDIYYAPTTAPNNIFVTDGKWNYIWLSDEQELRLRHSCLLFSSKRSSFTLLLGYFFVKCYFIVMLWSLLGFDNSASR